jgi:hypothetical protein
MKELISAVPRLLDSLRTAAAARGHLFSTIGVSTDSPPRGIDWLKRFGDFDEVVVGRNWMNTAIVQYVWSDRADMAGMPQILLVEHRVQSTPRSIVVGQDRVVRRWYGAGAIAPEIRARQSKSSSRATPGASRGPMAVITVAESTHRR